MLRHPLHFSTGVTKQSPIQLYTPVWSLQFDSGLLLPEGVTELKAALPRVAVYCD